ncbi:Vicilin-like antimicrobial peptides 2-1 [Acorus calamus]|uniref:Vicilin-like antimicrobial peptides 2-1 n=1 Tax=Acorus calamus TaxID=4465 RepID=A0AAV9D3A2_ACOCL|nr:Vicilin-like antimicrobial peptides 2-1 [Acorus calamus]
MATSSKIQLAPLLLLLLLLLLSLTLLSSATTDPPYESEDPELQQCKQTCRHQQLFDPTEKQQCKRRCEEYIQEKQKRQRLSPLGNFKATVFEVGLKKVTHPRHFDAEVLLYVMSGNGIIEFIGGDKTQMRKGDVVRVPAGTNFYVTTDGYERLHIVKLVQPVFINGRYQGPAMAPYYNLQAIKVAMVVNGCGYYETYHNVRHQLSRGMAFVAPVGHPFVAVASPDQELHLACFEINASDYQKNFLPVCFSLGGSLFYSGLFSSFKQDTILKVVAEEVKQSRLTRQQGRRMGDPMLG